MALIPAVSPQSAEAINTIINAFGAQPSAASLAQNFAQAVGTGDTNKILSAGTDLVQLALF